MDVFLFRGLFVVIASISLPAFKMGEETFVLRVLVIFKLNAKYGTLGEDIHQTPKCRRIQTPVGSGCIHETREREKCSGRPWHIWAC
jgi:hypothetical protein